MIRRRYPFYRQLETMDCGPTCLRMVARFYGRDVPIGVLRDASHIDRQGASMVGLCDAAEAVGLRPTAAAATFDELARERPFPAVVHWRREHFVVLYDIDRRGRAHIADPAHGPARLSRAEFERSATGPTLDGGEREATILYFEPTPDFVDREAGATPERRSVYGTVLHYALPYRKHFAQIGFGMAAAGLVSLAMAFLSQALVDVAIGGRDLGLVKLILIAQLLLFAGSAAGEYSRSWLTLHMGGRINIAMASDFLAKLTRLPMSFFEGKMTGDLMQRMTDLERIRTFLISTVLTVAFMLLNLVLYSALLIYYDVKIFTVFFVGSALYIGWIALFLRKRKQLDYLRFEASSGSQSGLIGLIQGMQEIKMHGAERRTRWRWERLQVRLFKVSLTALNLEQIQGFGSMIIHRLKNILVTVLAAQAVIHGEITLGMMMTVQFILGNLDGPVTNLANFSHALQDAKLSMERVNEVLDRADEEPHGQPRSAFPPDRTITLHNLSFSYGGPSAPLVLEDVELVIPEGKITAIVGTSGSGKSTLLKLLLKYYPPTSGRIEIGGRDASAFLAGDWRERCGVVMQDGWIFSDTIAGNIALADEAPDQTRLMHAARLANVQEFAERLPLGYDTAIGPEGVGLSGGQRQRILIARAIYRDPEYLFFDEATSSLDAENERAIMENLTTFCRGRTVVVIAHRLSTVRAADQIVVMSGGRIIERGTHDQLARTRGTYFSLIRNQLELAG
ncbi:MAG TPA: peptidase domain-containing ABC transporter [Longimicrobium sp.]|jgi:ATP-binding cassette subfamily B protein